MTIIERIDEARRKARAMEPADSRRIASLYKIDDAEGLHERALRQLDAAELILAEERP